MKNTAQPVDDGTDRGRLGVVARPARLLPRLGIRGCLFAAFAGITGMTVLASGVTFVSYTVFGRTLDAITVENMPAVEASLRVAKTSAEIAATAPALVAATSMDETVPVSVELSTKQFQLAMTIQALKQASADAAAAQKLDDFAASMRQQLDRIAANVKTRITDSQERESALRRLEETHRKLLESLAPLVDDAAFDVATALVVNDSQDIKSIKAKLTRVSDGQFDLMQKLNVLHAESNLLFGLLTTAATAPRREQFVPLHDSVTATIQRINKSFDLIKTNTKVASIGPKLDALTGFGQGPDNVFDLRERELDATADGQRELAENRDLADRFSVAVEELVTRSEEGSRSAALSAANIIAEARKVLVATTAGGLVIAFAVGWLYVGRRVVRRLAFLRQSMLAIAGGDLTALVPQSGSDEISEMANAVQVFKENKIEADRLTGELHKAQGELLRNERLSTLGQLTATVAHELRNPLSAIRNTVFALNETVTNAGLNLERPLTRIERNIQRCNRIITDLLDFTRMRDLTRTHSDVDAWLDDVLNEQHLPDGIVLRREFGAHGLSLSFDSERLRRVVINLIENAAQAMTDLADKARCITVTTAASTDSYELAIEDTGPGIPSDVLAKVFEPLFSTKSFGTGLGLPTVRQIVEQHGGTVEITSHPGAGTRVVVRLPHEVTKNLAA